MKLKTQIISLNFNITRFVFIVVVEKLIIKYIYLFNCDENKKKNRIFNDDDDDDDYEVYDDDLTLVKVPREYIHNDFYKNNNTSLLLFY